MLLSKTTVVNDGNQIYRKQLLLYFFMHKVSHTQRSPPTTLKFLPLKFLYFQKQKMPKNTSTCLSTLSHYHSQQLNDCILDKSVCANAQHIVMMIRRHWLSKSERSSFCCWRSAKRFCSSRSLSIWRATSSVNDCSTHHALCEHWIKHTVTVFDNKKLSYCRRTTQYIMSVETMRTVAQMIVKLHLISPATGNWPGNDTNQ